MRRVFTFFLLFLFLFSGKLQEVQLKISLLERKLQRLEKEEKSLAARLERIDLSIRITKEKIKFFQMKFKEVRKQISQLQKEEKDLKVKLERKKVELSHLFDALYRIGASPEAKILADLKDYKTLSFGLVYLKYLSNYQARLLQEFNALLKQRRDLLKEKKAAEKEIKNTLKELFSLQKKLSLQKRNRKRELSKILKEKNKTFQLLQELKEKERELKGIFKGLEKKKAIEFLNGLRKGLSWPLKGRIVRRFGLQVHPVFRTKIFFNGIEIAPIKGEHMIKAVQSGKVVFVSDFRGYGKIVIIDHGRRYYTLYGHLAEVYVQKDQFVKKGDPIGTIGESSFWRGKTLYFEIRHRDKPLNPLKWLRRK